MILVQNHFSLISPGTEGHTVSTARKNLIEKAKERPQQVKQVLDVFTQQGPVQAYRAVMKKLEAYSPLGYSSAGVVVGRADDIKEIKIGDLVACGGVGYANHAEYVAVPENLCVKLDANADLKKASYNTLGAISMQGVRRADLRIGENCAVIGLGLIGQLTCLILKASGVRVIGIDINPYAVEKAGKYSTDFAFQRDMPGLPETIDELTGGIGVDSVIITAATKDLDLINFSGRLARQKGKIVVVGDVPTGFNRDPYYYRKELDLKMSCSYGPGRYDPVYEEKGIDYPVGYVRWTEKRNMQAFQELIHSEKINIDYLTTHIFKLDEAPQAYDLILEKNENHLGILIEYNVQKSLDRSKIVLKSSAVGRPRSAVVISFIGAGSYAQSHLLPNIPKEKDVIRKGVLTSTGTSSRSVAERYGFEFCASEEKDIFGSSEINTVFIATRHNTHAAYVRKALEAGKNVFVEKPLCLDEEELNIIVETYNKAISNQKLSPKLMLGFNRRFSLLTNLLKIKMPGPPMAMIYRVNAGKIPADSWIQDKEIGGGRIVGEVCHFIDYLTFINGSLPVTVFASAMDDPQHLSDTVNINLEFANGSIGTISFFTIGSKVLPKEYVEICSAGVTAVLKDFKELEIFGEKKIYRKKLLTQDKGQKVMVSSFLEAVKQDKPSPIPFEEIHAVALTTFKILESIQTRKVVRINE